jgi:hypothetical protein
MRKSARRRILDIVDNPNKKRYPNQKAFIMEINEYVFYVPFVEDENEVFLKTIIPSRRLKKQYLGEFDLLESIENLKEEKERLKE